MKRVAYFIDGFNSYHALLENNSYKKYKWLNYYKLAEVLTSRNQTIASVNFFTAYREWVSDSFQRHRTYVSALQTTPVNIVFGKFKNTTRKCKICRRVSNKYHEEKQTDVNIALHLLKGAMADEYDRAVLLTADTDLLPAIRMIKNIAIPKEIGILLPIGRNSNELRNESDFCMRIKEKHLRSCQFEDPIPGANIVKPSEWH